MRIQVVAEVGATAAAQVQHLSLLSLLPFNPFYKGQSEQSPHFLGNLHKVSVIHPELRPGTWPLMPFRSSQRAG